MSTTAASAAAPVKPIEILKDKATRLRIDSIRATTAAGSGHPTSCASAAEIVAALFFSVMRKDPKQPHREANDAFVLSKGHAAPILYSAWSEAGLFPREHLLSLPQLGSELEGHPTHYSHGGLGDAVQSALSTDGIPVYKIAITQIAHSGKPQELIEKFGISSKAIVEKVRALVG